MEEDSFLLIEKHMEKKVMGLGLSSVFSTILALTTLNPLRGWLNETMNSENAAPTVGFVLGILAFVLAAFAIVGGVRLIKKGEKSWVLWTGFIPAILIGAFWILVLVFEFFFE